MYQDYLDNIIGYYRTGKRNAGLPQRLMSPTPASIKKECLWVCKTRFEKKDLRTLTAFFAMETAQDPMFRVIDRCDRDRFKPLSNFLQGVTKSTDDLNLELLAWLIDFPGRPFRAEDYPNKPSEIPGDLPHEITSGTQEVKGNMDESFTGVSSEGDVNKTTGEALTGRPNAVSRIQKRFAFLNTAQKAAFAMVGVLLPTLVGFYFVIDRGTTSGVFSNGQQKCMVWVGDHYIPSSCEPRHGDTIVVAFDAERIKNFRRITRPDTITLLSEGKLWYIKRNGGIEYYTAFGRHPIEPGRILRPLTKYMILKYRSSLQ